MRPSLQNFLNFLLWMLVVDSFVPILLILHYITGFDVIWIFKLPVVVFFLIVILYHVDFKIKLVFISRAFVFLGFLGVALGPTINYGFRENYEFSTIVPYLYSVILPVLSISFGVQLAALGESYLLSKFYVYVDIAFFLTVLIVGVYAIGYFLGAIAYWGLGTYMHYYLPFLLVRGKKVGSLLAVAAVVISGKRAVLVNVISELLVYLSGKVFSSNKYRITKLFVFIVCFFIGAFLLHKVGAFSRFEALGNINFDNAYSVLVAFSGRWEEVVGILAYMSEYPLSWLIGAGASGVYLWQLEAADYAEYKTYAHFMPFAYLFRFGLPFVVLVYANFIYVLVKYRKMYQSPFYLVFFGCVMGSFFGANLLIDALPWVFYGILLGLGEARKKQINVT